MNCYYLLFILLLFIYFNRDNIEKFKYNKITGKKKKKCNKSKKKIERKIKKCNNDIEKINEKINNCESKIENLNDEIEQYYN